jgi:endonuclease III
LVRAEVGNNPMPATINKQHILSQLLAAGKASHDPQAETSRRSVVEQVIYSICREGTTREIADRAFKRLQTEFFDWNEVRVSQEAEVADVLHHVPMVRERARRIIGFLQDLFEKEYSFDLEGIDAKGIKQAAKNLLSFQCVNDFTVAWVLQQGLSGHAIPVDEPTMRVCKRLGLLDASTECPEQARASLEHLVPKAKGLQFVEVVSEVATRYCQVEQPRCSECPLRSDCPTGQSHTHSQPQAQTTSTRSKPR